MENQLCAYDVCSTISISKSLKVLDASATSLFKTATPKLIFVAYKIGTILLASNNKFC